jgi:hypothetical protein
MALEKKLQFSVSSASIPIRLQQPAVHPHGEDMGTYIGADRVVGRLQQLMDTRGLQFTRANTLCVELKERAGLHTVAAVLSFGISCAFTEKFWYHVVLKLEGRCSDGTAVVVYLEWSHDSKVCMKVVEGAVDQAVAEARNHEAEQRYGWYSGVWVVGGRQRWELPLEQLPNIDQRPLLEAIKTVAGRPYDAISWNCRTFVVECRRALGAA